MAISRTPRRNPHVSEVALDSSAPVCVRCATRAAANTAILVGVISDSTGAFLPGATVTATHVATNTSVDILTDGRGQYRTPPLRIGDYELTVRLDGFRTRDGFRKRTVRIDGRTIALRRARRASRSSAGRVYTLASGGPGADFLYYELSAEEYLLVPRECLPAGPVMFVDTEASTYQRFKNTVAALAT